jgi:hypothetical protein
MDLLEEQFYMTLVHYYLASFDNTSCKKSCTLGLMLGVFFFAVKILNSHRTHALTPL